MLESLESEDEELLELLDESSPKNARMRAMVNLPEAELLLDDEELFESESLDAELEDAPLLIVDARELRLLRLPAREPRSLRRDALLCSLRRFLEALTKSSSPR